MIKDIFTEINEVLELDLEPKILLDGGYVDEYCKTVINLGIKYTEGDIKAELYLRNSVHNTLIGKYNIFPSTIIKTLLSYNISEWFICRHFSCFSYSILCQILITRKTIEYLDLSAALYYVWEVISKNPYLDKDFLKEYIDKVQWNFVSYFINLSTITKDFVADFRYTINWDIISERKDLTEDFINTYIDKLNFYLLRQQYEDKFNRELLIAKKKDIEWKTYVVKPEILIDFREEDYIEIYCLNPELIIPWVFEGLSCKYIRSHKEFWDMHEKYSFGVLPSEISLKKRIKYFLYCVLLKIIKISV